MTISPLVHGSLPVFIDAEVPASILTSLCVIPHRPPRTNDSPVASSHQSMCCLLVCMSVVLCDNPLSPAGGVLCGEFWPGHYNLQVTGTCYPAAHNRNCTGVAVHRVQFGGARSVIAKGHRWRCVVGWVPHSHGQGVHEAVGGVPRHAERFPAVGTYSGPFWRRGGGGGDLWNSYRIALFFVCPSAPSAPPAVP